MRNIFMFMAIIIVIFVAMFADFNTVPDMTLGIMYTDIKLNVSFLTLCLGLFSLGIITGVLFMMKGVFDNISKQKKVIRQLERASIGADDSELKVRTLENKIKTLEIALQRSLKQIEEAKKNQKQE